MNPAAIIAGAQAAAQAAPAVANMFVGARGREKRANEQVATQDKLNEQAAETNYRYSQQGAEEAYKRDVKLYNELYSPRSLIKQGKEAGVNPITMLGGGGGFKPVVNSTSTPASGGAQAGQASTASQMMSEQTMAAQASSQAMQQAAMNMAEIENIKADTKLKESQTGESGARTDLMRAETLTNEQGREYLIENMRSEGAIKTLEAIKQRFLLESGRRDNNDYEYDTGTELGKVRINKDSYFTERESTDILKVMTDTLGVEATTELTNEHIKHYFQEILNGTIQAESSRVTAAAHKLSAEWTTGEFTNWRTWTTEVKALIGTLVGAVAAGKVAGR